MGYSIDIQFIGICCFATGPTGTELYKRRVLLPYDKCPHPDQRHIPFLEVAQADVIMPMAGDLKPTTDPYPYHRYFKPVLDPNDKDKIVGEITNGGIVYYRWTLSGHFIEFLNDDKSAAFTVASSYTQHVPAMKRNVEPRLYDHPRYECFTANPPKDVVSGAIDIYSGTLSAADFEEVKLYFKNNKGESAFTKTRPAKYVLLNLPLQESGLKIAIYGFGGTTTGAYIRLKPGATVRIGNAMEADISGPGSYISGSEHFKLFYNLDYLPDDPALPYIDGPVPLNACSPTDWP